MNYQLELVVGTTITPLTDPSPLLMALFPHADRIMAKHVEMGGRVREITTTKWQLTQPLHLKVSKNKAREGILRIVQVEHG